MAKVFKICDFIIFTSCFSFLGTFQLVAFANSNIFYQVIYVIRHVTSMTT